MTFFSIGTFVYDDSISDDSHPIFDGPDEDAADDTTLDARLSHEASLHATACNEGTAMCGQDCDAAAFTHEVSGCPFCPVW